MLEHNTLDQLRALKLHGCANALEEQMRQPNIHAMSFEERLALLVDREVNLRSERKQTRLLQNAQLKFPRAAIEDFDNRTGRGIERKAFMSLALSQWITRGDTILLTGPTGVGKSWLACALAQYACRHPASSEGRSWKAVAPEWAQPIALLLLVSTSASTASAEASRPVSTSPVVAVNRWSCQGAPVCSFAPLPKWARMRNTADRQKSDCGNNSCCSFGC